MPEEPIEVIVAMADENVPAGRLFSHRRRGRESASFSYDATYLSRPDAYALDPALPLLQGSQQTPSGLEMFRAFADSAPDRWGRTLVARAERRRADEAETAQRSLGEIDYLLGVRDDLRQGALRFRDTTSGAFLATDDVGVPMLTSLAPLVQAAEHIESGVETTDELRQLLRAGSSLGGARPKANVRDTDGRLAIAKFPSARHDTWNVMAWEKLALDLAEAAGITVPRSRLLRVADRTVLIVSRFDRRAGARVGYASALTMLEASDGDTGSYVDIAAVIEQISPSAKDDLHELWRRIAFSVLISNTDDHLRNHGFLHVEAGTWSLSPAFDLNPDPAPGTKHLSTAIDERDTQATVPTLLSVAQLFRLTEGEAVGVLREVAAATRGWRRGAETLGISLAEIAEMEPAFEHQPAIDAESLGTS
jgi:serine/threonine-protein kinase HipA